MVIYKITNTINGKCYIGQTRQAYKKRLGQHFYMLSKNKHTNKYLQNAYNKYGHSSFKYEVFACSINLESLNELEKLVISVFKSDNPEFGYNLTDGGESYILNAETRRQRSVQKKVFYKTQKGREQIEKLRQCRLGVPSWNKGLKGICKAWNKGLKTGKQSEELIQKRSYAISNAVKGKNNHRYGKIALNAKSILCIELNRVFKSSKEVQTVLGLNARSVRRVASGERNSIKGFTFKFI